MVEPHFFIIFLVISIVLEFSSVHANFLYLHEDIDLGIQKYILNKEAQNYKAILFGRPHYLTYFCHSEN